AGEAQELVALAKEPRADRLVDGEGGEELPALLVAQLAHLELELRAEDEAGARERGFELGRPLERGLRDIEREEHRLSRQKTKAAERLLLLGRELDGAKAFDRV